MSTVHMHPESHQNVLQYIAIGDYGIAIGVYCIVTGDIHVFR